MTYYMLKTANDVITTKTFKINIRLHIFTMTAHLYRPGQIARLMPIGRARACKTSGTRPILPCKKEKTIRSTNLQSNR